MYAGHPGKTPRRRIGGNILGPQLCFLRMFRKEGREESSRESRGKLSIRVSPGSEPPPHTPFLCLSLRFHIGFLPKRLHAVSSRAGNRRGVFHGAQARVRSVVVSPTRSELSSGPGPCRARLARGACTAPLHSRKLCCPILQRRTLS